MQFNSDAKSLWRCRKTGVILIKLILVSKLNIVDQLYLNFTTLYTRKSIFLAQKRGVYDRLFATKLTYTESDIRNLNIHIHQMPSHARCQMLDNGTRIPKSA